MSSLASLRKDMALSVERHTATSPKTSAINPALETTEGAALQPSTAESSIGDATLVENTSAKLSLGTTSSITTPTRNASPLKKTVIGGSPQVGSPTTSPAAQAPKDAQSVTVSVESKHGVDLQIDTKDGVLQAGEEEPESSARDGNSPMKIDDRNSPAEEGSDAKEKRSLPNDSQEMFEPLDLGYLHSVGFQILRSTSLTPSSGGRSSRIHNDLSSRSCSTRDRAYKPMLLDCRRALRCSLPPLWLPRSPFQRRLLRSAHPR